MVPIRIEPDTVMELRSLCNSCAVGTLSGLLTVWAALLLHLCDQTELVIGQPYSMRASPGLEAVVGCFINFLPVRLMQPKQTDAFTAIHGTQLAIADAVGHGNVPIQDLVKSLPRSTIGTMRNGVVLYQTMLQLIDDPAAASLVFQKREPAESDLSGLQLRISLLPTAEGAIEGVLNFPSDLLDLARAGVLVQSFQRLLSLVVRSPESPVEELAASVIKGTCLKEQGSSMPPDVTRALNRHEYAYLKELSKTRPTDLWSPRAASGLHWHNADHSAWLSHTNGCWEGWDDASGIPCSLAIEWEPWYSVCDDVSWQILERKGPYTHHVPSLTRLCTSLATGRLTLRAMACRRLHECGVQ